MRDLYVKICSYVGTESVMNDGLGDVYTDIRYKEKQLEIYEKNSQFNLGKTNILRERAVW